MEPLYTAGSLFSGIGGLDLGLERAGLCKTYWLCEKDKDASAVLEHQYPHLHNYGNILDMDWENVEPVDILHGGFPCQDVSKIGKRAGIKEGTRSGLWFEYVRGIRILRPRLVIVENVAGLLVRGMDIVLGDLAEVGYDARWSVLRASDVGAAHQRERVFIVAAPSDMPDERRLLWQDEEHAAQAGVDALSNFASMHRDARKWDGGGADASGVGTTPWGRFGPAVRRWEWVTGRAHPTPWVDGDLNVDFSEWHMGFPPGWTDVLDRKGRIKVLGNAVVPQCAEVIGDWALRMIGDK
jgi:DNA (cytosine-5)-methyltransferase 1